ncbi:putative G-protein coupled receptor 64-like [Scophthalmus maximus]|uniref:Putative G-protein coupled receptor 64-like n=1 Tax=Scophthalmus maximus TaxID=52904 RepID=A0A2U9BEB0_SCOMX|nr:putative G-protein coupled receptor 64-like [Scophthalmus maximus]
MNITITNGTLLESLTSDVKCEVGGRPCVFQCTFNGMWWFNGSSVCLPAEVTGSLPMVVYIIQPYSNCTLNLCAPSIILPQIQSLDSNCSLQRQMMELLCIRDTCPQLFSSDHQMKKAFMKVEKRIILNIMQTSQSETGGCTNYDLGGLSLNVIKISEVGLNSSRTSWIPVEAPQPHWLQCHYFDEHDSRWKTDGCQTFNDNQSDVMCSCNHATPFAILLIRPDQIDEVHWKILSHISYIGCGLSAFFTALSIVMYVFRRNHKMDYSLSIHVSLSGALFLLNSTFLLTEWGATMEPDWVCIFLAAFMHYSLLCCFTWMAIEALHLYLLLIKVFNTHYKQYLLKLSLLGWGIPGVFVSVAAAVKDVRQFYGVTQMSMANTNQTNAICWITDDAFFYTSNLVYFTLVFIFNSGILLAVALSICRTQHAFRAKSRLGAEGDLDSLGASCRSGLTVLGLTCLMGTTWGLAFLGSGYVNYSILYLFCILNSTQGFFVFLWVCQSAKMQRKQDMEDRMTSSPMKTSEVKSD